MIIGFDIGQKGGIAILDKKITVQPMPLLDKKTIDWSRVSYILEDANPELVVFESVYPPPNLTASMNLGKQAGIIEGMCIYGGISYVIARPQVWKARVLKGLAWKKNKKMSIQYVQGKYPDLSLLPTDRCKVPSDGMADAVCLAEYGKQEQRGLF